MFSFRFVLFLTLLVKLSAGEITVWAAVSLTDSLKAIAADYSKSTGETISYNFAASNTLVQQIKAGAPADIFISADEAKMDQLAQAGLIDQTTRRNLLENSLVIIIPKNGFKITKVDDLTNVAVKHLSLGDPIAVPAGVYAKAWLEKIGMWQKLQPKIVPAENVRAALAVVESGNAEAGIVYKTDAIISKKVEIAMEVSPAEGPKIIYPGAVLSDSRHAAPAKKFLQFLAGKQAAATFKKFGFSVID